MSSTHDDLPDSEGSSTASLVATLLDARSVKCALEALEISTLAAAAAVVAEQTAQLRTNAAREAEIPERVMVAEIAAATNASERTVQRQLRDAEDLCARFAPTVVALRQGRISGAQVRVIHEAGHAIEDADALAEYEKLAIARALTMTPGRLRPILHVLAARVNPRSIDVRHAEARADRSVWLVDLPDGMADVTLRTEAVLAHGIFDRLTQQAQAVITARRADAGIELGDEPPSPGDESADTRTMNELRADVCADLLLTGTPESCIAGDGLSAIRAVVQVTVPVLTAAGTGGEPAVLTGHGPIDTGTARILAGGATGWERVMTSPVTGAVLAVDRYRPSSDLVRFLRARDEHCRFPGCRMPVWRCQIDHTIEAARGGPTSERNLEHLCQGHHTIKGATAWAVVQLPAGVLEWTSPIGRKYVDRPDPTLRFVPDPPVRTLLNSWRTAEPDDPIWHES
ncbi:DUF222 domain-containing protein [uncultured Microbacterium sp.]|uniref:HNH endonuclease n=1 Tax=uncultured Microbacterium sp. TaxID=191216 RepID=UPI0035CC365F